MKNETLELTIASDTMKKLKAKAKVYHKSVDWLVQQGVEIASNLDLPVFTRIHNQATRLELPIWCIIEHYFIDRWAYESAEREVRGPVILLTQFARKQNDELIVGEELFNLLKDTYVRELKDYNVLKIESCDKLAAREEMRKYLKPGELAISSEELARRKTDSGQGGGDVK
jgi:hypothetical protein